MRKFGRRYLTFSLVIVMMIVAACDGGDTAEAPDDPVELLTEAANNMRAVKTFGIEIRQEGIDYEFISDLGEGEVLVTFRRAIGQYVAPDQIQLDISIRVSGVTVNVLIYGRGDEQWYRVPIFGWQDADFATGFNPETLIAEDTGFQAALASLIDLEYEGLTSVDGTETYKLSGSADGTDVADLLVGLIEDEGEVDVEVYIDTETRYPIRITIIQKETDPDDPMRWIIDLFDINADPDLILPEEVEAR